MNQVAIAVCTRERPNMLRTCLQSLFSQNPLPDLKPLIIVIVNGPETDAAKANGIVAELGGEAVVVSEPAIGLSNVRNRALQEARQRNVDALIFVDDDQIAPPDFFSNIVTVWRDTGAHAVKAWVTWTYPFESRLSTYIEGTKKPPAADEIVTGAATNGVLIDARVFTEMGLRFDPAHNFSGGEDTTFFRSLNQKGGKILQTPRAVISEFCPAEKLTLKWICKRAFTVGAEMGRHKAQGRSTLLYVAHMSLKAIMHLLIYPITYFTPRWHKDLRSAVRNAGKVYGVLFELPSHYKEVVGD